MNELQGLLPRLPMELATQVLAETGVDDLAFLKQVENLAEAPVSAILLSGGKLDCANHSMAAWDPLLVFRSRGQRVHLATRSRQVRLDADPLTVLDTVFALLNLNFPLASHPFAGGAVGYFAYDLKNQLERLPQTVEDDLELPDIFLFLPRRLVIHDRRQGSLHSLTLFEASDPGRVPDPLEGVSGKPVGVPSPLRLGPLQSNFTHEGYLEAVRRVRRYIRNGDVYQVNLSQRFRFRLEGSPFQLWRHLFALNPAPFYAFIQAGDHQVLSTSMERFLYRCGPYLETRPIKGTRPRGKTPEEDRSLRDELAASKKDDAELSMIVDLLRNDLGRVCGPRSVRVAAHKRLETYQNVHHLVSVVTGEVGDEVTYGQILRAAFPGGSITGCPKIRAMEIIDELEPHVRHVYTGAIGYLGGHGNMDLNVAIRTALVQRNTCYFSVGGGIVFDSDEEEEYRETLHKARTLLDLMEKLEKIDNGH